MDGNPSRSRKQQADQYDRPSSGGIILTIVKKYSGQSHFVFELLQNADDAGATDARFVLESDRLLFYHNGTRRFSISAPDIESEFQDARNGRLGDINSITAVGNSSKIGQPVIGKFGIGFKAAVLLLGVIFSVPGIYLYCKYYKGE